MANVSLADFLVTLPEKFIVSMWFREKPVRY
jgi:hypothetical protein